MSKPKPNPNYVSAPYEEFGLFLGDPRHLIQEKIKSLDHQIGKKHMGLCKEIYPGEWSYLIKELPNQ